MSLRFSLLGLIGFTTFAALASAALVQPGINWTSVIVSLTGALLVWQVLRLLLTTGESRAGATGWLLFAVGYLGIVLGPWSSSTLGPQLATSRGLAYAQVNWHKIEPSPAPTPQQQWLDWAKVFNFNTALYDGTSSTIYISELNVDVANGGMGNAGVATSFQLSGHWLASWLAGWLGAVLAVQFQRRREHAAKPTAEPAP